MSQHDDDGLERDTYRKQFDLGPAKRRANLQRLQDARRALETGTVEGYAKDHSGATGA